MIIRPVGA